MAKRLIFSFSPHPNPLPLGERWCEGYNTLFCLKLTDDSDLF